MRISIYMMLILFTGTTMAIPIRAPSSVHHCKMSVAFEGPGSKISVTAEGSSPKKARDNARIDCGTKVIDRYLASHREVDDIMKDELALACVNLECE